MTSLEPAMRRIQVARWTFLICAMLPLSDFAAAQVPFGLFGPALYFKQNASCLTAPNCRIPASAVFPNPNAYTKLVTLTLPRGNYFVTSKLSAFAAGGTSYVNFECALLDTTGAPIDFSSFDGTAEQTLFMQSPVTIATAGGTDVHVGCRAYGFVPDGSALVDMHVWNVNLAAMHVGPIHSQQ